MLLEKKPVSKRKRIFFTLACCFFMRIETAAFTRETRLVDPKCRAVVFMMARACGSKRRLALPDVLRAVLQDAALTCRER